MFVDEYACYGEVAIKVDLVVEPGVAVEVFSLSDVQILNSNNIRSSGQFYTRINGIPSIVANNSKFAGSTLSHNNWAWGDPLLYSITNCQFTEGATFNKPLEFELTLQTNEPLRS